MSIFCYIVNMDMIVHRIEIYLLMGFCYKLPISSYSNSHDGFDPLCLRYTSLLCLKLPLFSLLMLMTFFSLFHSFCVVLATSSFVTLFINSRKNMYTVHVLDQIAFFK